MTDEFEETMYSSRMQDLHSVMWEFVTDEVKREVNILKEEWKGCKSFEELANLLLLVHLLPHLLLLAVGTLLEVVSLIEIVVNGPDAAMVVWLSACVI